MKLNLTFIPAVSGNSEDIVSTTKIDSQYSDDLKKEVETLKMKLAAVSVLL